MPLNEESWWFGVWIVASGVVGDVVEMVIVIAVVGTVVVFELVVVGAVFSSPPACLPLVGFLMDKSVETVKTLSQNVS